MEQAHNDAIISPQQAVTLYGLFCERVKRTPDLSAFKFYNEVTDNWEALNWSQAGDEVARWSAALASENLQAGERVAIMMQNCPEWAMFDLATHANELVDVPLYTQDRAENVAYILQNAGVKVLLIGGQEHWDSLHSVWDQLGFLTRIISLAHIDTGDHSDIRLIKAGEWLPDSAELPDVKGDGTNLATIVYTSGTTGRPKGVMLSHHNILWNAWASLQLFDITPGKELFLSFLPLSHTLERSAGYYLPLMSGSTIAYNRSIPQLAGDLLAVKPTVLMAVPRIFERIYNKIQTGLEDKPPIARALFKLAVNTGWRRFEYQQKRASWHPSLLLWPLLYKLVGSKVMAKLGGNMRFAIIGGAPLPEAIARLFIGLGLPMLQGYGLTETSPVISVNSLEDNDPKSVGVLLKDVETKIGEHDELVVRSPGVMLGYWANEKATSDMIDQNGWLHTGDQARIDNGHVYITGRLKEIIVLANGEKVPPADMEMAICMSPLFEQAMVIGDNRPYLTALVVLSTEQWATLASEAGVNLEGSQSCSSKQVKQIVLGRIAQQLSSFPGYAKVRQVCCQRKAWSIEDGFITPTLKLRRNRVYERFEEDIDAMYKNH